MQNLNGQYQVYLIAIFETVWELRQKSYESACGHQEDYDPKRFGDLQDVDLLDDRIRNQEDFDTFMR